MTIGETIDDWERLVTEGETTLNQLASNQGFLMLLLLHYIMRMTAPMLTETGE